MGALCCCLGACDERDDTSVVEEDSGDFSPLKWFFQKFIKKRTTEQTPGIDPRSQQPPPSNPGVILNRTASRTRVQPEPACRESGGAGDNAVLDLKPRQGEEVSHNDEDSCPTCFYEYTEENPKIVMKCSHHYHLSCIYEWMERSEYCPACRKMMLFEESS